jgi:hypothetical protein
LLDIAIARSVVDLFKELVGLVRGAREEKRKFFERVIKPLYDRLELVAKEYHSIVEGARSALGEKAPDLDSILKNVENGRKSLILARNGVIGEADAFLEEYGETKDSEEFERLAYEFAKEVSAYFYNGDELLEGTKTTLMSGLIGDLLACGATKRAQYDEGVLQNDLTLNEARRRAENTLRVLERGWIRLSASFTRLKLNCET